MTLRQQGRPVRLTKPGGDKLVIERMVAEEYVSAPFRLTLDLLSDNPAISPKSMLREDMTVEIDTPDGVRCLNGKVARFAQVGRERELTRYRAEVVPSLWFTTLGFDNRIFQQKSVTEIAESVLTKAGVQTLSLQTTAQYDPREYCVQYGESNFAFVSRLLEDEGIFYVFRHTDADHEMILADENSVFVPCPGAPQVRFTSNGTTTDGDVITEFERESVVHPGVVTLRDYNYLEPSANLERSEGQRNEEVYRFPGGYLNRDVGGKRAKLRLDAAEALEQMVQGGSTARGLTAGGRFKLREHWDSEANVEYYLLVVRHFVSQGGWHSTGDESFSYGNQFTAVPFSIPYKPQAVTPVPRMHGTQTAVVVGKAGEEIYTDAHGRVKVQFHWDREGQKDENSSCWVRVSSAWAGKGYGSLQLPRIGQEVIVDFLEGDPDRPIITGRVFNAEQAPPCDPGGKGGVISGFRSKTHKGSGYNEMTLDDSPGKEKVTIHGQYDMSTTVGHDQASSVGNNRTTSVSVDDTETIGSNQKIDVGADQKTNVGANRELTVGSNDKNTIGANQTTEVGGNLSDKVGGNRTVDVGGTDALDVGGTLAISSGGKLSIAGDADVEVTAGGNVKVSGTQIEITGTAKITLSAAGSTVEIGPSGITIQTGAIVNVQGATIKLN